jgi:hypothetical protein
VRPARAAVARHGRAATAATLALALTVAAAGCGLKIQSPDLFLLQRSGPGGTLSILVNTAGFISCDRGRQHPISSSELIAARDLADNLGPLAQRHLRVPFPPHSVYRYTIRMQQGTISFPDTAGARYRPLADAEQFSLGVASGVCRRAAGSASA